MIEDGAQTPDVGARVEGLVAARLLRRHVVGRPHHRVGARETPVAVVDVRDPEVEDLHRAVFGLEDVRGLEIAVDDVERMCRGETSARLDREVDGLLRGERALLAQPLIEIAALEELERDVRDLDVDLRLDHLDDVRMIDPERRLAREALRVLRVGSGGEHLHRDQEAVGCSGGVHDTHPAAAQDLLHLKRADLLLADPTRRGPRPRSVGSEGLGQVERVTIVKHQGVADVRLRRISVAHDCEPYPARVSHTVSWVPLAPPGVSLSCSSPAAERPRFARPTTFEPLSRPPTWRWARVRSPVTFRSITR